MNEKLQTIVNAVEDKKGKDILILDFKGKSSISDYAFICTGRSERNIQAIVDEITKKMREMGEEKLVTEGYDEAKWVLLDYGDIVVHIFSETTRSYYSLESLWVEAEEIFRS